MAESPGKSGRTGENLKQNPAKSEEKCVDLTQGCGFEAKEMSENPTQSRKKAANLRVQALENWGLYMIFIYIHTYIYIYIHPRGITWDLVFRNSNCHALTTWVLVIWIRIMSFHTWFPPFIHTWNRRALDELPNSWRMDPSACGYTPKKSPDKW